MLLGKNYEETNNYELAAIYYKKATYIFPGLVEAWIRMCMCYIALGDANTALEYLEKALEHNPDSREIHTEAARLYLDLDYEDTVAELLQMLLDKGFDDEQTWFEFILMHINVEKYERALELVNEAYGHIDDQFELNMFEIICLYMTGKKELAYELLRTSLVKYPKSFCKKILAMYTSIMEDIHVVDIFDSVDDDIDDF